MSTKARLGFRNTVLPPAQPVRPSHSIFVVLEKLSVMWRVPGSHLESSKKVKSRHFEISREVVTALSG